MAPPAAAAPDARVPKRERPAKKERPNYMAYSIVLSIFGLSFLAFALQLYDSLFPDRAIAIPAGDTDLLNKAFFSGAPGIFMCRNDTHLQLDNGRARDAFEAAMKPLKREGFAAYTLDCTAPLKGAAGPNALQFWKLSSAYQPVWGYVGYGKTPVQMTPQFTGNPDAMAKLVRESLVNRAMKVGNSGDLASCLRDRTGGCVLVYTSRPHSDVAADLAPLLAVAPTAKFGTLNATSLRLASPAGSVLQRVLAAGVRVAKEASLAAGRRGELLVLLKRLPPAGAGGSATATASGGSLLVTLGFSASPGAIAKGDVEGLLAKGRRAREVALGAPADGGAGDDVVEALLAREEALERLDSAQVGLTGDLSVDRLAAPAPPPTAAGGGKQQQKRHHHHQRVQPGAGESEGEDDEKASLKAAHRAKQQEQQRRKAAGEAEGAPPAGQEPVDPVEVERRRRQQMASEEAASAFVAHAAGGDEEEEAALVDDDAPAEEEAVDLADHEDDAEL